MKPHLSKPAALWIGAALLLIGLIVATIAIVSEVRSRAAIRSAEEMAAELRANGAIVENYHPVLEDRYPPISPSPASPWNRIPWYLTAGVLLAGGSVLLWKASTFPPKA